MGTNTKIEWAHHTFNGWIGCQKAGPGCDNCYAETWDGKSGGMRWGPKATRTRTTPQTWNKALKWERDAVAAGERHRVFASSLSDVFDNHASIDPAWRRDLAAMILKTPNLDWMLLSKRIGNAEPMLGDMFPEGVPSNLFLGATIVTQKEAERDLPVLVRTKKSLGISRVFLSMEPLLERVVIAPWLADIDWVIVGGESGPDARPMHIDWVRSLRDQCAAAGTPFLFKQWGEWFPFGEVDAEGLQNTVSRGKASGLWLEWKDAPGFSVRIGKVKAGRHLDGRTWDGIVAPVTAMDVDKGQDHAPEEPAPGSYQA
ncbi:phage Gp37/Gp68 family protein [Cereibacter sphaeroides]|uniref:phage Gp37/Gp68 family protein n=1 Tax=Cereibacter sphaeroides TaxID=1063 RepID=UPI001F38AC3D|nr:phage Gp37/Gp68 family protein [Cereibacter sphaeroides]MCE6959340.1 phage Gp37/Gp68 family protein [Cereibacter sphaeroides]MCE6972932.1 phage Gp37/Gp68 family protein [Cereibacter sphaeroides]